MVTVTTPSHCNIAISARALAPNLGSSTVSESVSFRIVTVETGNDVFGETSEVIIDLKSIILVNRLTMGLIISPFFFKKKSSLWESFETGADMEADVVA